MFTKFIVLVLSIAAAAVGLTSSAASAQSSTQSGERLCTKAGSPSSAQVLESRYDSRSGVTWFRLGCKGYWMS
jgi:hypothetical protein